MLLPLAKSKEIPYLHYMIVGRVTAKSQTTVPKAVRNALGLKPGDAVAYEIVDGRVEMKRLARAPEEHPFNNPFATFTEWDSEADRVGYANL